MTVIGQPLDISGVKPAPGAGGSGGSGGSPRREPVAAAARRRLSRPWATLTAIVLAALWTLPTFGLLVTSFRDSKAINTSGWWTALTGPFTLDNYRQVLDTSNTQSLAPFVVNSLVITVPSVVLPVFLATLAAYAFAWMRFRGRDILFVAVFALQVVPIQVTLIPLLQLFVGLKVAGSFWAVWLAHTAFGLPLAVFLLHNFMREIPGDIIEAARVDGAGHVTIFFRLMLPMLKPALAAFGIYQFLWVWNDLLVALTFAGSSNSVAPMTVALYNMTGTRGSQWYLLSAGAFVSILVPMVVFLSLQKYFVRGLLAGSIKG